MWQCEVIACHNYPPFFPEYHSSFYIIFQVSNEYKQSTLDVCMIVWNVQGKWYYYYTCTIPCTYRQHDLDMRRIPSNLRWNWIRKRILLFLINMPNTQKMKAYVWFRPIEWANSRALTYFQCGRRKLPKILSRDRLHFHLNWRWWWWCY